MSRNYPYQVFMLNDGQIPRQTGLHLMGGFWEWWDVDEEAGIYVRVARWPAIGLVYDGDWVRSYELPDAYEVSQHIGWRTWPKKTSGVVVSASAVVLDEEMWRRYPERVQREIREKLAQEIVGRMKDGRTYRVSLGKVQERPFGPGSFNLAQQAVVIAVEDGHDE